MRTHIQHHNHNLNSNTLAAEIREDLFGELDIFDLGTLAFASMIAATLASLGIYLAVFYLI